MSETEQRLPWRLARLADCMDPSKRDSAGAGAEEDDAEEES